ncbi:MAG: TIGR03790 family protein [Chthoniobacteraceae bacterium]
MAQASRRSCARVRHSGDIGYRRTALSQRLPHAPCRVVFRLVFPGCLRAEHAAGPFVQPGFRFEPGAVAVHIHSFSATTLRSTTQQWCGPLLAVGAAATLGNVYEPYLGLTPELDIFYDRLQAGFTFAESAYMAQRSVSWMTTVIGDPLYRPFQNPMNLRRPDLSNEWEAYAAGARIWYSKDRAAGTKALEKSAARLKSGVILEGLGLLQLASGDPGASVKSFERAERLYKDPPDRIRVTIHEAFQLVAIGRKQGAIDRLREQIARYSAEPATDVLRIILAAFTPPPPPPPKKPGSAAASAAAR